MITLHWTILAALLMVAAVFGLCVFALLKSASDADDDIERMK